MKKFFIILVVCALVAPAMAVVTITAVDKGDGKVDINYTDTEASQVRAFALDITVDSGAVIAAVDPCYTDENTAPGQGYGIFPGTVVITAGDISNVGTPVAEVADAPGDTQAGIGNAGVTIEMGSLYVDSNNPATEGTLCQVTVTGTADCYLSIAVNGIRAGIVREDATQVASPTLTGTDVILVSDCLIGGNAGVDEYPKWVRFSKPDCWCYAKQCRGDGDGLLGFGKPVVLADVTSLRDAFGKSEAALIGFVTSKGIDGVCADYDHKNGFGKPVVLADITILRTYFGVANLSVPDCATAPVITGPYNFWTTP